MADHNTPSRAVAPIVWAVVIALYAIYVAVAFVGFASYMVRTDWEASLAPVNPSDLGVGTSLDTILFTLERESDLIDQIEKDTLAKSNFEAEQARLEATLERINNFRLHLRTRENNIAGSIFSELRFAASQLPEDARRTLDTFTRTSEEKYTARANEAFDLFESLARLGGFSNTQISDVEIRIRQRLDKIVEIRAEDSATYDTERDIRVEILRFVAESERMKDRIERANTELDVVESQVPQTSPDRARFAALGGGIGEVNILQEMVRFPTIFLTLIVTVAMGGLGSLVAVSRDQLRGRGGNLGLPRLVVRIVEGIAAAFAIFLLSGAGLLALSQGSTGAGSITLSPYSVAFVAFVSGLMAENAFGAVRQAGQRILQGETHGNNGAQTTGPGEIADNAAGDKPTPQP